MRTRRDYYVGLYMIILDEVLGDHSSEVTEFLYARSPEHALELIRKDLSDYMDEIDEDYFSNSCHETFIGTPMLITSLNDLYCKRL